MLEAEEGYKKAVLDLLEKHRVPLPVSSSHPDFWFFLASQLAFERFSFEEKRGRPIKWNQERDDLLIILVKQYYPKSEKSACDILAKTKIFKGINAATLYRRLHTVKKRGQKPRYSELAKILAGL